MSSLRHARIMTQSNQSSHGKSPTAVDHLQVVLRGPGDLAEALPFLLGYHATDSLVLLALHGERGAFGGRVRIGLPDDPRDPREWPQLAGRLAELLVSGSVRRFGPPSGIVAFLCKDPSPGERSREVMERLRPLAQHVRVACGELDVPVVEALCLSGGRWWSYCRPSAEGGGGWEGVPLAEPGTSAIAATAAYAGVRMPATLRDLESRLRPPAASNAEHETALDLACARIVPRMLDRRASVSVVERTAELARSALDAFAAAPLIADPGLSDSRDDALLAHDDAAEMILGLQERAARDRVVEWADPATADAALRLWRALARRCAGPYAEHAAVVLALAGWVAWCAGDDAEARVALGIAVDLEPHCTFALLLQQAISQGIEPEVVRQSLRATRRRRIAGAATARRGPSGPAGRGPGRRTLGVRGATGRR
jgi:hypothetical protein